MTRLSKVLAIGVVAILSTHAVVKARSSAKAGAPAARKASPVSHDDTLKAGIPGVEVRKVYRPDEVKVGDDQWVTGIVVEGQARAYLEIGMNLPETHIAYDEIDGVNVAVAFCSRSGDARVFCGSAEALQSVRVGGWENESMQLLIGDQRFALDSPEIQLNEIPFKSMKWSEWKALHPNTKIYLGDLSPSEPMPLWRIADSPRPE